MPTIKASCHCGLASFEHELPSSAFPLKSAICHCSSCRHVTGQTFVAFAVIPAEPPDVSMLTEYRTSASLSRYFCPRCGASVCNIEKEEWEFATGMLDVTEGVLNRVQLFIEDTRDGGVARWLADAAPEMHPRHRDSPTMTSLDVRGMSVNTGEIRAVQAECHCGNVKLDIAAGKYEAFLDACRSCRKVTGFEIVSWATIPKHNITMRSGEALNFGGMGHYKSSEDVNRYFCRRCGATVFWAKNGGNDLDIGTGLIRGSGARVEEILEWVKKEDCVSYVEDAIDLPFVQALVASIQKDKE